MKVTVLYILTVVLVNYAFEVVPIVHLPGGEAWPPVSLAVGFVFVIRDFAQRAVGHLVLPAMLAGGLISGVMASPEIALASMCAFFISELLDWFVYTYSGRPFSQRILLSGIAGAPVDSAVFLWMIGVFSLPSVLLMTASKLVGTCIVAYAARRREASVGVS